MWRLVLPSRSAPMISASLSGTAATGAVGAYWAAADRLEIAGKVVKSNKKTNTGGFILISTMDTTVKAETSPDYEIPEPLCPDRSLFCLIILKEKRKARWQLWPDHAGNSSVSATT